MYLIPVKSGGERWRPAGVGTSPVGAILDGLRRTDREGLVAATDKHLAVEIRAKLRMFDYCARWAAMVGDDLVFEDDREYAKMSLVPPC